MKRLRKAELRFLPCKAALVMADLFLLALLLGCFFQPENFSDVTDYVFMSAVAVCLLLLAVTYSYFKPSYRSVPGISRILGRQELEKLFENENFVPRNLIAMMWIDERGIGIVHLSGITKGSLDERLLEKGAELARDYGKGGFFNFQR